MDKSIRDKYISVIGLEVHAQLLTKSKIYNTDSTEYGSLPNTNVGVVTLAHPGTLPRLNKRVVEYAIKMGLACHSEITRFNIFDRKNYFYPDLTERLSDHAGPHAYLQGWLRDNQHKGW